MILYVEQPPFRVYFREHGETWGPGLGRDMGACSNIMRTGNIPLCIMHTGNRDMGACWGERSYSGTSETNPRAQARPFTLNISMAPSACSLRLDEKMHCYCQVCSQLQSYMPGRTIRCVLLCSERHKTSIKHASDQVADLPSVFIHCCCQTMLHHKPLVYSLIVPLKWYVIRQLNQIAVGTSLAQWLKADSSWPAVKQRRQQVNSVQNPICPSKKYWFVNRCE